MLFMIVVNKVKQIGQKKEDMMLIICLGGN
jgi:hypothetical protein